MRLLEKNDIPFDSFFNVEVWKCGSCTDDVLIIKMS